LIWHGGLNRRHGRSSCLNHGYFLGGELVELVGDNVQFGFLNGDGLFAGGDFVIEG
jgi:hypothetical protein